MEIIAQLRKSRRSAEKSEQFETDDSEDHRRDELTYDQDTDVRFFYLKMFYTFVLFLCLIFDFNETVEPIEISREDFPLFKYGFRAKKFRSVWLFARKMEKNWGSLTRLSFWIQGI